MRILSLAMVALGLVGSVSAAPMVANGDFETGANLFTASPGYVGQTGNPSQVTGFSGPVPAPGGTQEYGINPGNGAGTAFRDNGNDNTNVLFIQAVATLSQAINGFSPGGVYNLSFDYNARTGTHPLIYVFIGNGVGDAIYQDASVAPVGDGNPYHTGSLTFTATDSTQTLSIFKGNEFVGDSTALFDNFSLTQISLPTPEPTSLTLLGLGVAGLVGRAVSRQRS